MWISMKHPRKGPLTPTALAVVLLGCCVAHAEVAAARGANLAALDQPVAQRAAAETAAQGAAVKPVTAADIRCGTWQAIGPFKDAEFGVFAREFELEFAVEKEVVQQGAAAAGLEQIYQSVPVVGAPDATRRWAAHPEWTDGYQNALASGPPPGRNEVTYLYRTITCASPIEVTAHLVTLDAAKAWLDGKLILNAPIREGAGQRFLRPSFKMALHAGENRLLVKIAKCFQKNSFAFAIEGLHPMHPWLTGPAPDFVNNAFGPACQPYAPALQQGGPAAANPPWYRKMATWQESWDASRAALAAQPNAHPGVLFKSPVLCQKDGPQHVRLKVAGLQQLVLLCTIGGDNYNFDDTIWADPKLITADGREVSLTELKPSRAEVGHMTLFTDRNHAGKPLQIGGQEYARGFWAHAPSVMIFDLAGKFEQFDTSFGLDVLASSPGSAEFVIADSVDAATQEPMAVLQAILQRDFPAPAQRDGIDHEFADRIWDGVDPAAPTDLPARRYAEAIRRTMLLEPSVALPADFGALRSLYQNVMRFDDSLRKLRGFRFDVEPMPGFDPAALKMQAALDRCAPSAGGAAYLLRLAPAQRAARAALAGYGSGQPGAAADVIAAAEAIDRLRAESIRAAGPVVFVRHPSFGRINAVNPYETPGAGPASIAVFDPATPAAQARVVYDDPAGGIFNMSLSFDARTIFFSAKRAGVPGGWHIYEIGVDGSNLKQITSGGCDDISPAELPNGDIIFVSDRNGSVNVCQPNRAGVLFVCSRDGGKLRRVSANTLSDHSPTVMNDGRVMFTRWDYGVDKGVFQRHGVWAMNPDGTHLQLFFGNTILDPNAFWQCTQVPGRPEVVSSFGGHHSGPYGVVGLLWDQLGQEAPRGEGFRWLTPDYPTYFDGGFEHGYIDPFPINENEFLVSYGGDGGRKSRIYLLDSRGNKTCIFEDAANLGCYNPIQLQPRRRPPVIPAQGRAEEFTYVDPVISGICPDESKTGVLLLDDVYNGLEGSVKRGEIHSLQIMELVPKTRPHAGNYAYNISPLIGRGTFYVRRLIGTVPVETDGSAHFVAPALRDISFNALDAEGRVIQKMGSSMQLMPGELYSCAGCHTYQNAPGALGRAAPLAGKQAPAVPQRPDWGTQGIIDYVQVVQPVWDKYCVKCHSGAAPNGGLDLSGDKTRYFNMSYDMLIDRGLVHHVPQNGADHDLTTPKANGSLASGLLQRLDADLCGHGQTIPRDDRQRVYTWIDANVPYYHTYLYTDGGVNGARDRWYDDLADGWFKKEFEPVFMNRCYDCHKRTVDISDAWLGNRTATVTSKVWSDITIMDQSLQIENSTPVFGPDYRINLTHPEWSQMLTAPLAKQAGGLGLCQGKDGAAVFKDVNDADYQAMLQALQKGRKMLELNPRVDMLPRPDPAKPEAYAPGLQRPRVMP
jgi:hypothetical protein